MAKIMEEEALEEEDDEEEDIFGDDDGESNPKISVRIFLECIVWVHI